MEDVLRLDPRTKLLLLVLVTAVVLGGVGGSRMQSVTFVLSLLPCVLLFTAGYGKEAVIGMAGLLFSYLAQNLLLEKLPGTVGFLLLFVTGIWLRILPGVLMSRYVMETTKVSEFIAAFEKMHVPMQLTIPLSVMFRFFPTVGEEFHQINAAMKMRDIRWGGNKMMKMVEYRLVPMLTCSAKIGEELSAAALTRGLGGKQKRTNICQIGFGVWDVVFWLFGMGCVFYGVVTMMGVGQ